ncbi:MAG: DUF1405 domain-containing protein [Halobacteria archaeon]
MEKQAPAAAKLFRTFLWFRRNKTAALLILLTNVGGVLFGFYYYAPQFADTPPPLWLWVPDSPLAVGLFAAVLWLDRRGEKSPLLETLAFIGLVKVGLWTAFVLKFHADAFYAPDRAALSEALYWLHLGMVAEAFLLRPSPRALPWALGWYLLDWALDYGLGIHPRIPARDIGFVRDVTLLLLLGSAACACAWRPGGAGQADPAGRRGGGAG